MRTSSTPIPGAPSWQLPVLIAASALFESFFLHHGINPVDEGWTLYTAKRWLAGAPLYSDVFLVFPPGHMLASAIGLTLDPPGLVVARLIYAAFAVSAVALVHRLGSRVMPPGYAFFGALLLAVGAPRSHLAHHLFGYRYIAFSLVALGCFARRLDGGDRRWVFAAGLAAGTGFCFRLDALAAVAAIGAGSLLAARSPRDALRDGLAFAAGAALVITPVALGLVATSGTDAVWREVFVRPVAMTRAQSLPIPSLALPAHWAQPQLGLWFAALQFRLYGLLYSVYLAAIAWSEWRARRQGSARRDPMLAVLVIFGICYFTRALGRSDEAHLDSALPPACLILAHALWRIASAARLSPRTAAACGTALLAGWTCLLGTPFVLLSERGELPLASAGGRIYTDDYGKSLDWVVHEIRARTQPGDVVLDGSWSPLVHVLAERDGPGGSDILMPGSFLSEAEEQAFIARLERNPPKLVIWPTHAFDDRGEQGLPRAYAPALAAWVRARFEPGPLHGHFRLMTPIELRGPKRNPRS
jgi:hypothetical protein